MGDNVDFSGTAETLDGAVSGVAIQFDGKRIPLKWHRLRRQASDVLFGAEAFAHGTRIGAAMEVDLRVTADGEFAILHNAALEEETDGNGLVRAHKGTELARLHYRDERGAEARPVLIAADLARGLAGAHPEARLQLDMKDAFEAVGDKAVEQLAAHFSEVESHLVVSGDSTLLTLAISARLPGMLRGLEPSFRLIDLYRAGRRDELAGQLVSELQGPMWPHIVYLSWPLILAAKRDGIDLISICHAEGALVDAWTFALEDPQKGFSDAEWQDFHQILELGADQITTDEALSTERAFNERMYVG